MAVASSSSIIAEVSHSALAGNDPIEDKSFFDQEMGFFGVYDGHGGLLCSEYLSQHLHKIVKQELDKENDASIEERLRSAFIQADALFIDEMGKEGNCVENCAGSCCIVTLIRDSKLWVANAGDSRAILVSSTQSEIGYSVRQLSNDHNSNSNEVERKLVAERTTDPNPIRYSEALAEHIRSGNYEPDVEYPVRVAGTLMVTRAFGDAYLKRAANSYAPYDKYTPYITVEPEIDCHELQENDQFLVMASDGLWEILSNEEVAEFVLAHRQRGGRGHNTAQHLIQRVLDKRAAQLQIPTEMLRHVSPLIKRAIHDDITLFILFFSPPAPLESNSTSNGITTSSEAQETKE